MRFGSLFAGLGGFDLGLERAGLSCAWQVEIDPYAQAILQKHWPEVPKYRDVRFFLGGKRWRRARHAWSLDLICGGFPCQDISNAGKRVGIDGPRSGLWREFSRIVRLLRPRYVLVENVPALTLRGLGRVLGDLSQLGYDAEWDLIPAASVGAPHRRWRLFLLAYANGARCQGPAHPLYAGGHRAGGDHRPDGAGADANRGGCEVSLEVRPGQRHPHGRGPEAPAHASCRFAGQRWRVEFAAHCERTRHVFWPDVESVLRGMVDGLAPVLDGVAFRASRIRCLGNAVLPQIAEHIGRRLMAHETPNPGAHP